jgi:hypothetical protein
MTILCESDKTFEFLVYLGVPHVKKVDANETSHYIYNGDTLFIYDEMTEENDTVIFDRVQLCKTFSDTFTAGMHVNAVFYHRSFPELLTFVSNNGHYSIYLSLDTNDIFLRGNKDAIKRSIL